MESTIRTRTYGTSLLGVKAAIEDIQTKNLNQHQNQGNAIKSGKKNGKKAEVTSSQATFTWVDINFTEKAESSDNDDVDDNDGKRDKREGEGGRDEDDDEEEDRVCDAYVSSSSFSLGDKALNDLYTASDVGTVMLVLTQADITPLVMLLSKKQR